jgi:transposase-like protein
VLNRATRWQPTLPQARFLGEGDGSNAIPLPGKLSYRDVCDLMAERGVTVVHTTVLRWVQRFVLAFEKKWKNYARPVGSSWRVDETYIKVNGQWRYLYRAVDTQGQTVDFLLSENRDRAAAVRFFKKAIGNNEVPEKITLDGSRASHQAIAE